MHIYYDKDRNAWACDGGVIEQTILRLAVARLTHARPLGCLPPTSESFQDIQAEAMMYAEVVRKSFHGAEYQR